MYWYQSYILLSSFRPSTCIGFRLMSKWGNVPFTRPERFPAFTHIPPLSCPSFARANFPAHFATHPIRKLLAGMHSSSVLQNCIFTTTHLLNIYHCHHSPVVGSLRHLSTTRTAVSAFGYANTKVVIVGR